MTEEPTASVWPACFSTSADPSIVTGGLLASAMRTDAATGDEVDAAFGHGLAELERLAEVEDHDHREMARETLDVYAPLADRFGMGSVRKRLEDASFRLLEPTVYEQLRRSMAPVREVDEEWILISFFHLPLHYQDREP